MILNTIVLHYKAGPINMIWLLLSVFDWSIIMIGPGGLLLVVPTYLQSRFQFYWWVAKKKTKLGCEKYFCRVTYWAPVGMLLECQGELVGKAIESNIYFHGSFLPYSWGLSFEPKTKAAPIGHAFRTYSNHAFLSYCQSLSLILKNPMLKLYFQRLVEWQIVFFWKKS
jgi:hypothetical protein